MAREIPLPDPVKKALASRGDDGTTCDRCGDDTTGRGQTFACREDRDGNILGTVRWCVTCMEKMTVRPPGSRRRVSLHELEGRKFARLLNAVFREAVHAAVESTAAETMGDGPAPEGGAEIGVAEFQAIAEVKLDQALGDALRPVQDAIDVVSEYETALGGGGS